MARDFNEVLEEASRWIDLPSVSVVAQGQTEGKDCILVHLTCKRSDLQQEIPDELHGYPVEIVEETDEIVPHD